VQHVIFQISSPSNDVFDDRRPECCGTSQLRPASAEDQYEDADQIYPAQTSASYCAFQKCCKSLALCENCCADGVEGGQRSDSPTAWIIGVEIAQCTSNCINLTLLSLFEYRNHVLSRSKRSNAGKAPTRLDEAALSTPPPSA
jgi:hypothetical protein